MDFKITAYTDIGLRKSTNQDSVMLKVAQTDYGKVLLATVCDGMGGLVRGELASATMVRMLSDWFEEAFPELLYQEFSIDVLKKSWEELLYRAGGRISKYGHQIHAQMGTTMVVLLIIGCVYYIINVGDSRIYMMKDTLTQITKDQTMIQREMDEGRLTLQEVGRDPRRNVLLQCVGASPVIVPDYYSGTVDTGSMFLLCSDGFHHTLSVNELYQYLNPYRLSNEQSMLENLKYLVEMSKHRQETDNISAALVRVD